MQVFRRGVVEVRWLGGALIVRHPGGQLLVEAPEALSASLHTAPLAGPIASMIVSGNRLRSCAGLLPLWDMIGRSRPGFAAPLQVLHPLEADRVAVLVDAWSRGWPHDLALELDGVRAGSEAQTRCGAEVTFAELAMGEQGPDGSIRRVVGCGVRIEAAGVTIAWLPSGRLSQQSRQLVAEADLAVIEVGRLPWPRTDRPWRLSDEEAMILSRSAHHVWLVGDDGTHLHDELAH